MYSRPLSDPAGTQPLVAASRWLQQVFLGTPAVIVATLAVAAIGFLMMSGRIPLRRGIGVVAGCFVLFGAVTIAQGIMALVGMTEVNNPNVEAAETIAPLPPTAVTPPPQPQVYDPYAGASVPTNP